MDTNMIGSKIAKARKEINMSQAQLAQLMFISPQAVGKWERGESIPDIITINRLAEILGVDLNYFSENFPSVNTEENVQIQKEETAGSSTAEQPLINNFNGSNLVDSDFAGVVAQKRKFNGSALRGSDFSGADLTGSSFKGSDVRYANFDGANLTDCVLSAMDLTGASFNKTILVRTEFSKLGLYNAKFANTKLVDVKLTKSDLTKTRFENCVFEGVDFNYSDLRGVCFDGQTFIGVKFHNGALNDATFKGATLKNVSFRSTYAITNRYYRALKTISFDGAMMDKLTYASLKGLGADLSNVAIL